MTIKLTNKDKIILNVSDDLLFEMIAMVVDNDEFVAEIKELRSRLNIVKVPYEEASTWYSIQSEKMRTSISLLLSIIQEKFAIGDNLDKALQYALIANCITDAEVGSAFCIVYPFENPGELVAYDRAPFELETPTVAIFLTEQTKKEEVLNLMDTQVKDLFKTINSNRKLPNKFSPSVRKSRDWYWRKKDMTYDDLYEELKKELGDRVPESDTMRKAIQRYRRKISVSGH